MKRIGKKKVTNLTYKLGRDIILYAISINSIFNKGEDKGCLQS